MRWLTIIFVVLLPSCAASRPGTRPDERSLVENLGLPTTGIREVTGTPLPLVPVTEKPVVAVALFLAPDCPVSNAYAPEIGRLISAYSSRGVRFLAVYADPRLSADAVRQHAVAFDLHCLVLLDPKQELVRLAGATVTPEAAVFNSAGTCVYLGRIDDLYYDYGRRRAAPTTRELRDALDAVLAGNPVAQARAPAIGCEIPPP
jgi:hypothetical protein